MKQYPVLLMIGVALALLVGCETSGVTARIQEKSNLYNNLEPWRQRDIQQGIVNVGDSTDIVYMALGKPSKIVTSADGQDTVWTYNNYYPPSVQSAPSVHLRTEGGPNYTPRVVNPNAPGNNASLSATGIKGTVQTSLDIPDLPPDTLYVTFRQGQVAEATLESEKR